MNDTLEFTLQEPITFDKMQEIFGSAKNTTRFFTTDESGNVTAEFINAEILDDMRAEIAALPTNNVSRKFAFEVIDKYRILKIIDKHIEGS